MLLGCNNRRRSDQTTEKKDKLHVMILWIWGDEYIISWSVRWPRVCYNNALKPYCLNCRKNSLFLLKTQLKSCTNVIRLHLLNAVPDKKKCVFKVTCWMCRRASWFALFAGKVWVFLVLCFSLLETAEQQIQDQTQGALFGHSTGSISVGNLTNFDFHRAS